MVISSYPLNLLPPRAQSTLVAIIQQHVLRAGVDVRLVLACQELLPGMQQTINRATSEAMFSSLRTGLKATTVQPKHYEPRSTSADSPSLRDRERKRRRVDDIESPDSHRDLKRRDVNPLPSQSQAFVSQAVADQLGPLILDKTMTLKTVLQTNADLDMADISFVGSLNQKEVSLNCAISSKFSQQLIKVCDALDMDTKDAQQMARLCLLLARCSGDMRIGHMNCHTVFRKLLLPWVLNEPSTWFLTGAGSSAT